MGPTLLRGNPKWLSQHKLVGLFKHSSQLILMFNPTVPQTVNADFLEGQSVTPLASAKLSNGRSLSHDCPSELGQS